MSIERESKVNLTELGRSRVNFYASHSKPEYSLVGRSFVLLFLLKIKRIIAKLVLRRGHWHPFSETEENKISFYVREKVTFPRRMN